MRTIAILGSTGSIGRQTLEVVEEHPDLFEVYAITAHRSADLLIEQARKFKPEVVVIVDENQYDKVKEALADLPIKVWTGADALCQVVTAGPIDTVVTAMVGFAGLRPTVEAIKAQKALALANKETLVVAGQLIEGLCAEYQVPILPVDSEHSAIFQCLQGESVAKGCFPWLMANGDADAEHRPQYLDNPVEKLIITASGGPFRTFTMEQMRDVTAAQALKHPNWDMGAKITIDSASMMNKGFEVIEARWLFGMTTAQIEVAVHPQSIVHSMVQFADGAIKAQLGCPDMKVPIAYALSFPERMPSAINGKLTMEDYAHLTFERPDLDRFPNLRLAYEALAEGGDRTCVLNAANEVTNEAFRRGQCKFLQMADVNARSLEAMPMVARPSLDDYIAIDAEARVKAREILA
ncbi:MAG: 1-deoxy-D-xylulose-5-phosphate reductoisomerase, partial [Bacteroidales bacterium]|nr:1-deoxy-D-xylulose-5-phosphate reductoisomerase [Bacteroidales bacterium]